MERVKAIPTRKVPYNWAYIPEQSYKGEREYQPLSTKYDILTFLNIRYNNTEAEYVIIGSIEGCDSLHTTAKTIEDAHKIAVKFMEENP